MRSIGERKRAGALEESDETRHDDFLKEHEVRSFPRSLENVSLLELVRLVGSITGERFVFGKKVKRFRSTIYSPNEIGPQAVYQLFLRMLKLNGLTVVESGVHLKIVPIKRVSRLNTPLYSRALDSTGDRIVTEIVTPKYLEVGEIVSLLERFKSDIGDIHLYVPENMLIITDTEQSLSRMKKLISVVDEPGAVRNVWIEPINYADVGELKTLIEKTLNIDKKKRARKKRARRKRRRRKRKRRSRAGARVVGEPQDALRTAALVVEERTNSLIIVGARRAYYRILSLIRKLDIPISGEGKLHIYKLKNAKADSVVKIMKELVKGSKKRRKKRKKRRNTAPILLGDIRITSDKSANALLVVSLLRDYLRLKPAIDKLDARVPQVFIEAVIMDVGVENNREVGFAHHTAKQRRIDGRPSLLYNVVQPYRPLNSLLPSAMAMNGLATGIVGPAVSDSDDLLGAGVSLPSFGVTLQALQTNSNVNVLSSPYILAIDNEESTISVGENIPLQTGYNPVGALLSKQLIRSVSVSSGQRNAPAAGGRAYRRQDVGLTLKVTPHTSAEGQVKLEVDVELSGLKSVDPIQGADLSKRHASTTMVVSDQQTAVIGGLVADSQVETIKKVPILGDVPILGFLFRYKTSRARKQNLLIFMTPHIVRREEDLRRVFKQKLAERRAFIERNTAFADREISPDTDWSRTAGVVSLIDEIIGEAKRSVAFEKEARQRKETSHNAKPPFQTLGNSVDRMGRVLH